MIKEVPRFQKRRHEQVYVPIHSISPRQHSAKWYPVYSAHAPQRSPRRYGQQPEGGTNLFLDTRFEPPVVRVHAAMEMWRIVHHGLPAHLASKQEDTLHRLGLTDKEILALAAGLVTFKMTTWINSVLMARHANSRTGPAEATAQIYLLQRCRPRASHHCRNEWFYWSQHSTRCHLC